MRHVGLLNPEWVESPRPLHHPLPTPQSFAKILLHVVFSIGYSQIEEVRRHIASQEEHHRKLMFQDELRRLWKRYEVAFDEA